MQVKSILEEKGNAVATVTAETPVMAVVENLAEKNIGAIVIVDAQHGVEGILSERDVVRAMARHGATALDQPVSDYMTTSVVTCGEHESVHDLMSKMTAGRFRHVPVVADTRLVGIISIGDVVKWRIEQVQREAAALRDYIASS